MQETRIVLRNVGKYNPSSVAEFCALGGYSGLKKALTMDRKFIVDEVRESGLRGRGGAGFSTGTKWGFVYNTDADQKYIVCNAMYIISDLKRVCKERKIKSAHYTKTPSVF